MGGGGAREVKAVSAHSDADTVYFSLGWSNGGNHSGICEFTTLGDGGFCYKEDRVGAGRHGDSDTLGKAS